MYKKNPADYCVCKSVLKPLTCQIFIPGNDRLSCIFFQTITLIFVEYVTDIKVVSTKCISR